MCYGIGQLLPYVGIVGEYSPSQPHASWTFKRRAAGKAYVLHNLHPQWPTQAVSECNAELFFAADGDTATTTSLQFCDTYTDPCTRCFFGASTTYLEFPFTVTSTVDVTIIPYVTQLADGSNSTSLSTVTTTDLAALPTESGAPPVFEDDSELVWTTGGVVL